ncbi:MAG: DUF47 family protein [Actinomycetota bacterium]
MRLSLTPRSSQFYDLFAQVGANALEAARAAEARFREWPRPPVPQERLKDLEHAGDRLTHDIVQLLNTNYVTPFDREDIYELASRTDDVVDHVYHASELLDLYGVADASPAAVAQCHVLVDACEALEVALRSLKGRRDAEAALLRVKALEDDGDRVHRQAIGALFHDPDIDPLVVIRWKDIHEALENAVDACEGSAHVIGNILVKSS